MADPVAAGNLRRLVERAGLNERFGLQEAVEYGIKSRALIAVVLPRAPLGGVVAAQKPRPESGSSVPFARMSATQRITALLERTPSHLGPDLAAAFRRMVTVEALAGIAAAFVVLLAAQFVGVGEIADAALAWWAYTQAGLSGVYGLYEALRAVVAAVRAPDEAAFEQAVIRFAEGLSEVGVALLTVVVTRAARKSAGGAEGGESGGGGDGAPQSTRGQVGRAAAADTEAARMATARAFYEKAGWPEGRINAHLRGIDFSQDVSTTTLKQGQTVTQWVDPAKGTGNYFAPAGSTPGELGISGDNRVLQTYTVTQDTEVLQSTAKGITPDWSGPDAAYAPGGGTQWFAPDTANFQQTGGGP